MKTKPYPSPQVQLLGTMETSYGPTDILWGYYPIGGSPYVLLVDKDDEDVAVLSVNLVDQAWLLGENEFFVKTWSENEEFIPLALATGLFAKTGRYGEAGFVRPPIWRLVEW